MIERVLLSLVSISLWASLLSAQTTVLFLGNSYTAANDLPNTFRQLALSLGEEVTVSASTPGGYTLEQHATYAPSLSLIDAQPWDFVVMQEQSQYGALPLEITPTLAGAAQLSGTIEANFECTYPVFYMTWGRENGDAQNCANFPFMCTYDGMQQGLRDNYVALAEANEGYTAPVGAAWQEVRATHPEIQLYQGDGSHPSVEGTYLAACVFYCTLYQVSCVDASFLGSLPPETAVILRTIASTTVLNEPTTWNLDVANGTDATISGSSGDGTNVITFLHPGQGTHVWTTSDGQTSTEADPTFTFGTIGNYTITHIYTDPCGNTDSVSWVTEVLSVGLNETHDLPSYRLRPDGPLTVVAHGGEGALLTMFDTRGRSVLERQLTSNKERITCPSGLFLWHIRGANGQATTVKVVIP